MRRLLTIAGAAGLVWWLFGRGRGAAATRATVGYADGSSLTLEHGAPELERLQQAAREAVGA
jgi:hypothetical protein